MRTDPSPPGAPSSPALGALPPSGGRPVVLGWGFNFCISLMTSEVGQRFKGLLAVWASSVTVHPCAFPLLEGQSLSESGPPPFSTQDSSSRSLVCAGPPLRFAFDSRAKDVWF